MGPCGEHDPRPLQRGFPHLQPEPVPRDVAVGVHSPGPARGVLARGAAGESCGAIAKTRSSGLRFAPLMCAAILAVSCVLSLRRRYSLSLGYSLTRNRSPLGWNFGST